ncbi:MAG: DUF1631 family protein [Pseudomonadota bacterium]
MEDLLSEIRMMRNSGHAQQMDGAFTALFDEIRDLAVAELPAALGRVLDQNKGELLEMAGHNTSHAMYCLYMDTWDQIKAHQTTLRDIFGRHLFQRFVDARSQSLMSQSDRGISLSELDLVEPEELEMTLASNTISHAIRLACSEELRALDHGMALVQEAPTQDHPPQPLAPEALGEVLMEVIRTLQASNKIKLLLVTRLNAHFPAEVKALYQRINKLFLARGIVPPAPQAVRASSPARNAGLEAPSAEARPQTDLFATLQQLMSMGRIGAAPAGPLGMPGGLSLGGAGLGEAANESVADSGQALQMLTRIQHGEVDHLPGGTLDPKLLQDGSVNVLRVIKHTGAAGNMNPVDTMTLDIVALIFDYILDDHRLPDAMKALIGRLQIPVLKVAMLDKAFFSQKSHPARKFLDLLADAALGWNPKEGHDSLFYQTVDTLVQQVINEFEDNLDVFSEALESLQSFLDLEKRQADERSCHHAQLVQQTEQMALVQSLAIDAVQARCLNQPVPAVILRFLLGPWATHLANLYRQDGLEGGPWQQGLATVDDLIWSLHPKASKEDRQRLVAMLPSLLKRLDDGISDVQLPRAERDQFFTDLVKLHSDAVKSGLQGTLSQAPGAETVDVRTLPSTPIFKFDGPDLHEVPLPQGQMETDARILREISSIPSPLDQESEEIVLAPPEALPPPTGDKNIDYYEQIVGQLKRGAWLEFTLEDSTSLRAKLAWVSPLRGTYLFTNRLGERAVSINAAGLAQKLLQGEARLVDNTALIDRAVSSLFDRLRKP